MRTAFLICSERLAQLNKLLPKIRRGTYLATVKVMPGQTIVIRLLEYDRLQPILRTDFIQEHLPYRPLRLGCQVAVPQRHVDTRLESIVERLHAIRCEEQDPLEILQQPEEDGYQGVAVDVLDGALLEEDVGFIEEKDGAPAVRDVEDFVEFGFQFAWVGAEFAGADHVKRAF